MQETWGGEIHDGMRTVSESLNLLVNNLEQFQRDVPRLVIDTVKDYEAEVSDLVTEEQLMKGIDAAGQPITPAYSPFTVRMKRIKGQPTDRVTWKDKGDLHKSIFVATGGKSFAIGATDPKLPKLERKYGNNVLGLTKKSLGATIDLIRQEFIDRARKMILKNF
jgi:hypothetical protein